MEPEKQHTSEIPLFVWFLGGLAAAIILAGLFYPIVFCEINTRDTTFISALFSLAGVIIFTATLVYQIKEFSLQAEELKKSVEAQICASKTMEAQRHEMEEQRMIMEKQQQLLTDQNTNSFLFSLIDNFNKFKEKARITEAINLFDSYYSELDKKLKSAEYDKEDPDLPKYIAIDLISSFENWYNKFRFKDQLQNFSNYSTIVFILISDKRTESLKYSAFMPIFHNQFSDREKLILVLINSLKMELNYSEELTWKNHIVNYLIKVAKEKNHSHLIDTIDKHALINELNKIVSTKRN